MTKRKIAKRVATTRAQLDKLIEEATVDCHDEDEQTSGFFNMIEDALAVPFVTPRRRSVRGRRRNGRGREPQSRV